MSEWLTLFDCNQGARVTDLIWLLPGCQSDWPYLTVTRVPELLTLFDCYQDVRVTDLIWLLPGCQSDWPYLTVTRVSELLTLFDCYQVVRVTDLIWLLCQKGDFVNCTILASRYPVKWLDWFTHCQEFTHSALVCIIREIIDMFPDCRNIFPWSV